MNIRISKLDRLFSLVIRLLELALKQRLRGLGVTA